MTSDNPTSSSGDGDDEPITPEVVDGGGAGDRRGAAARKRRVGGPTGARGADDGGAAAPGVRPVRNATGSIFRAGCFALMLVGLVGVFAGASQVVDASGARCNYARAALDDAADQDVEDWDHVPLPEGADDAEDVDCDEAVVLAGNLPTEEEESICGQAREAIEADGLPNGIDEADDIPCDEVDELTGEIADFDPTPPRGDFASNSQVRTTALVIGVVGLAQLLAGHFLRRTKVRRVRTVALIGAALGIITGGGGAQLTGLGVDAGTVGTISMLGLVALIFCVYALAFSTDARAYFPPNPAGGGFLRPRFPKAPPAE